MIKSMTGFGKGEASGKFGRFTVEIRTVNHRYFDVSSRIPSSLSHIEDRIKDYLHKYIKRGKVNFFISHRKDGEDLAFIKVDEDAIKKYYKILSKINTRFKLKDEIKLSHIFSFPDVIVKEQPEYDASLMWPTLASAINRAVLNCNKMRETEGRALYKDLADYIDNFSRCVAKIAKYAPEVVSDCKRRLHSKIKDIVDSPDYSIDKGRLETELAIFARQSDISEEVSRAKSHLEGLKEALVSGDETGRRLDFILQELQREVNTIGSKVGFIKISRLVVDIKSEIEKMREQAQNVE